MFENQPAPLEVSFHTIAHRPIHTSLDRFAVQPLCSHSEVFFFAQYFIFFADGKAFGQKGASSITPFAPVNIIACIDPQPSYNSWSHQYDTNQNDIMALRLHITWRSPVKDNAQEYGLFTKDYIWRLDVMRGCLNNKVRTTRRWGWERRQYCLSQSWQTPRKSRLTVLEHTGKP